MLPFVSGAVFKPTGTCPCLTCYHHRGWVCSVNNKKRPLQGAPEAAAWPGCLHVTLRLGGFSLERGSLRENARPPVVDLDSES